MKKENAVALASIATFSLVLLAAIVITIVKVFVVGTLLTSGVKAMSEDCGTKYPVEKVFYGNLFCPKK